MNMLIRCNLMQNQMLWCCCQESSPHIQIYILNLFSVKNSFRSIVIFMPLKSSTTLPATLSLLNALSLSLRNIRKILYIQNVQKKFPHIIKFKLLPAHSPPSCCMMPLSCLHRMQFSIF